MSLRKLGHKRHLPHSLGLLALGEAGCHFVRRSPSGEKLRLPASNHVRALSQKGSPAPAKRHDLCLLGANKRGSAEEPRKYICKLGL